MNFYLAGRDAINYLGNLFRKSMDCVFRVLGAAYGFLLGGCLSARLRCMLESRCRLLSQGLDYRR